MTPQAFQYAECWRPLKQRAQLLVVLDMIRIIIPSHFRRVPFPAQRTLKSQSVHLSASLSLYDMINLLTAVGLSPGGSTHLHINNTQNNTNNNRTTQITNNVEECGPCPVFASFALAFVLQLRKKHGKTSVRVSKTSVRLTKTSVSE